MRGIQVGYRLFVHQAHPKSHHTLFPIGHLDTLPHVPRGHCYQPLALYQYHCTQLERNKIPKIKIIIIIISYLVCQGIVLQHLHCVGSCG